MKYLFTFSMLCIVLNLNAQIRSSYQEASVLKPQTPRNYTSTERTEFTCVSFTPARIHLKLFLHDKLAYERNGSHVDKLNDSVVLCKERYIIKNDDEINPKSDFLDVEYKLHLATFDSIIEKVTFTGSENMIGAVFKTYWNTEINLLENADQKVVASCVHMNDSVQLIQTISRVKQETTRSYSILVSDKNGMISKSIFDTKVLLADAYAKRSNFYANRKRTVYQLKKENKTMYDAYKSSVSSVLIDVLRDQTNSTGNLSVVIKADTIGQTWIEIFGKNASVNTQLRGELLTLRYENVMREGYRMTTVDTFYYDYSAITEEVDLRKSTAGIHVRSTNFKVIETAARAEALRTPITKADMEYNVSYVEVNGEKNSRVVNTSTVERMTGGQVVLGILGGIGSLILWVISDEEE